MKKLLLSSVALAAMAGTAIAADLPSRKAPVAAPPAPPMWTGFHAGLNAGGIWNNNNSGTAAHKFWQGRQDLSCLGLEPPLQCPGVRGPCGRDTPGTTCEGRPDGF